MVYQWNDYNRPVPAQIAGEELERIEKKYGAIVPKDVVAESKNKNAPLHDLFEWDDTKAAVLYREDTARVIIRSVHVVVEKDDNTEPVLVKAFYNVDRGKETSRYNNMKTVFSIPETRDYILERAKSEFESFRRKYNDLEELADLFSAYDKLAV